MMFMNEHEINDAVARYHNHPVLSKATTFLAAFRDEVNEHSDGWPYWAAPVKAAANLMTLIQEHPGTLATIQAFNKSLRPIRSFYTRRGYAAGMKFPGMGDTVRSGLYVTGWAMVGSHFKSGVRYPGFTRLDISDGTTKCYGEDVAIGEALNRVQLDHGIDTADAKANLAHWVKTGKGVNFKVTR